jgi:hypothetical protein
MKIVLGFVATAALALAMGGCSSSSEDDGFGNVPDLDGVRTRFEQPDGTLSEGNASKVLEQGTNGSSSAGGLNFAGGGGSGSGSSSTQSMGLQLLNASSSVEPASFGFAGCSALASGQQTGSCACPSGGSIDYAIRASGQGGGTSNALMKFQLNACSSGETTIDGTEFIDIRTDNASGKLQYSMLLVIDATVTHKGVGKKLDLQWRYANGATEFAARVDDGWVVVSIKQSSSGTGGTWTVRDKNGSWTCVYDDGHGTCTSSTGATKKF